MAVFFLEDCFHFDRAFLSDQFCGKLETETNIVGKAKPAAEVKSYDISVAMSCKSQS